MKWSLLVGKFWGTELRLHASLLLLIPYTLVTFRPDDLPGALRVLLLIAAIFTCVALHEIGHTLAARLYGIQVTSIVLWPLGGFANLSRRPEKVLPDLVIAAAGPLTNLVIFAGLLALAVFERLLSLAPGFTGLSTWLERLDVFPFLVGLTIANLSLALFNLVPVYPLDGGQITRGLLKLVLGEKRADGVMLLLSLPLALGLTLYGFFRGDLVIILTGLLLVLAGATLNPRLFNSLTLAMLYFVDRGGYYLKRSDFDPAIREFTAAIQHAPGRPGPYVSRALAYMNLFELERARADVERALALDPKHFLAWTLRGELLGLQSQPEAALDSFNQAIEIRPNWNVAYLDRGSLYQDQGRLAEGLAEMDHSIELSSGAAINHLVRSILRHQMGDLAGAQRDADQALRYAPHWMLVFPEVFLVSMKGHLDWSLDYYWRALQRMPNAYQAFQGRADACRINERFDWAIADYERAIRLAPRQAELYLNRGRTYQQMRAYDRAAADFAAAARLAGRAHLRRQAAGLLRQVQPQAGPLPAGEPVA
jgi:Zn-dependent protease/Flp pilus assembly protein TadD